MTERRKRLIEVAFPLEEVSEHSRREKNVRHGHISTLHIWWARRPLAACRAFIYASLVDDPPSEAEREELLKEVADIASWDAVRKPDEVVRPQAKGGSGLTGAQLLERARERILRDNGGKAPRLLDPFAGGGAIPLEALRLGCEVEASDLNPVAVLILKGTVEYPQKYGRPLAEQREKRPDDCAGVDGQVPQYIRDAGGSAQSSFGEGDAVAAYEKNPLAADVRYWGNWMLEKAREELAEFYPADPDGSVPVAYLWSRTVPCPSCGAEMPLIRQYWLARKDKKKVALQPVIDRANKRVDFEVVEGPNVSGDPGEATTSRGDTLCLVCSQTVKAAYVRDAGMQGRMSAIPTAVVLEAKGAGGKRYRADLDIDRQAYQKAVSRLAEMERDHDGDLPLVPDEPMPRHLTGGVITAFGYDTFGKLFNARQMVALTTFARLVREAHAEMEAAGLGDGYAKAVVSYLGLAVDRLADYNSTLARWVSSGEFTAGTFARQALPMVWDYSEVCPMQVTAGAFPGAVEWIALIIGAEAFDAASAIVVQRDARLTSSGFSAVVTDPPYYDAINYADLSDFFYVWAKRSLGGIVTDALALPLTPKREQAVMNVYSSGGGGKDAARKHYVDSMAESFGAMSNSLEADGMVSVVFAHTDPDAWATLIDGLLAANLVPDASWPIDTERGDKVSNLGQARLKTSVWMACRPRKPDAGPAFLGDLREELRENIEGKLLDFWRRGIRGVDFFLSAIGPALSVYGRHTKVLRPDGSEVDVREFLDIVRRESTRVALQQVLQGQDLGVIDEPTRAYVTWVWSYGKAALDAGEAIALCLATGADLDDVSRPHSIAEPAKEKSKKVYRLRSIAGRARNDEHLGQANGAKATPLIDQLQYGAWLWSTNRSADLAKYRAELGEQRWHAVRVLGQAVADCLPDNDEDRRIIHGMLGSGAASGAAPVAAPATSQGRLELDQ
ncbi:MAG: DUF1156 domain-containing protein [Dehalococcoidia bacterium]|nr:DUF1156 domain-containing protein [Dehalococcoidia bacterium]